MNYVFIVYNNTYCEVFKDSHSFRNVFTNFISDNSKLDSLRVNEGQDIKEMILWYVEQEDIKNYKIFKQI